jgi:hypothetical protein
MKENLRPSVFHAVLAGAKELATGKLPEPADRNVGATGAA